MPTKPSRLVVPELQRQTVKRWPPPVLGGGGLCAKWQCRQSQLNALRLKFLLKGSDREAVKKPKPKQNKSQ